MFGPKNEHQDLEIFAIYDSKVDMYEDPRFAINQHDFSRSILNNFLRADAHENRYYVNAEDFSLFKIGSYVRKTGKITLCHPTSVCLFHELKTIALNQKRTEMGTLGSVAT